MVNRWSIRKLKKSLFLRFWYAIHLLTIFFSVPQVYDILLSIEMFFFSFSYFFRFLGEGGGPGVVIQREYFIEFILYMYYTYSIFLVYFRISSLGFSYGCWHRYVKFVYSTQWHFSNLFQDFNLKKKKIKSGKAEGWERFNFWKKY